MKLLLDTNVILDLLFRREKWLTQATQLWEAHLQGQIQVHISASAVTDVFYIVRRQSGLAFARESITKILNTLYIVPVDYETLVLAHQMKADDFEDNVQMACAAQAQLDAIVTRNNKDFKLETVLVFTPEELLQKLEELRK